MSGADSRIPFTKWLHEGATEIGDLSLDSGGCLPRVRMAWQSVGPIDVSRPVVLLLHGYTNSHRFWQTAPTPDLNSGWGNELVGPGAAIDSNRFLVIAINHLGSCYGSTGPGTEHPMGDGRYGLRFPIVTIRDQARAAVLALRELGIDRLAAVVGYSYGGYMAFELALDDMISLAGVVVLASGPKGNGSEQERADLQSLADRPSKTRLLERRLATLAAYGLMGGGEVGRAAAIWSRRHDPVSLLRLREAAMHFDRRGHLRDLRQPLFWLHVTDDKLFPPPDDDLLQAIPPQLLTHRVLPGGGHLAPVQNPQAYAEDLRAFLLPIIGRSY